MESIEEKEFEPEKVEEAKDVKISDATKKAAHGKNQSMNLKALLQPRNSPARALKVTAQRVSNYEKA